MCARIAISSPELYCICNRIGHAHAGQGVTGQSFVLPKTRAWTGDFSAMLKRQEASPSRPLQQGPSSSLIAAVRWASLRSLARARGRDQCALQIQAFSAPRRLLPTARDQLFEALNKGYADAIAAQFDNYARARGPSSNFVDPC